MAHVVFVDNNRRSVQAMETARRLGHDVTFIRSSELAPYDSSPEARAIIARVDRVIALPSTMDARSLTDALAALHAEQPIEGLICLWDFAIEATAIAARTLGLRFTNPDAVIAAKQKDHVRRVLDDAGLANARYRMVTRFDEKHLLDAARDVGFPCVVKPSNSANSVLAKVINGPEDLRAFADGFNGELAQLPQGLQPLVARGLLVEEKLQGEIVSVEIGRFGDAWYPYMVTGRRRSPENPTLDFGFVMPAMLTPEMSRSCVDYAKAIVALLNLDFGVFHLEMAITPDGPVLIECNTRLMGANLPLMYLSLSGIDLYEHVIRMFLGEAPPLPPATVTGGIASSSVIVSRDGHTAKDFTVDWRQPYADRIIRIYLDQNPEPDTAVEAGLNFGGFHVRGEDSADAYAVVGKLLDNFEAVTGVSVYK